MAYVGAYGARMSELRAETDSTRLVTTALQTVRSMRATTPMMAELRFAVAYKLAEALEAAVPGFDWHAFLAAAYREEMLVRCGVCSHPVPVELTTEWIGVINVCPVCRVDRWGE